MIQKETWYLDAIPQSDGRNKNIKYTPVSFGFIYGDDDLAMRSNP